MPKFLSIAAKDVKITFRDRAALLTMLLTPFVLALIVAAAFGGGGSDGTTAGLQQIPVIVINNDGDALGEQMVEVLQSEELDELLDVTVGTDEAAARRDVVDTNTVAAIIIPADFTERLSGGDDNADAAPAQVQVINNVNKPVTSGVVGDIVNQVLSRFAAGSATVQVAVEQLQENQIVPPQEFQAAVDQVSARANASVEEEGLITVAQDTVEARQASSFNWLAYMAPSMAIFFLMFTVANGGRSLLAEREGGTLPRLLMTPTSAAQILGGKMTGIFLTGLLQMVILLGASYLIMGIRWSSWLGLVLVTLALVAAATAWGAIIAAFAKGPTQAGTLGTTIALIFAGVSGNFVPRSTLPEFMRTISYIAPNSWGLEAYNSLTSDGTFDDVLTPILALSGMALVLFVIATIFFRRQYATTARGGE